jgi:hypothetical protein
MEGFVALTVEGYSSYNLSAASALVQQIGGLRFTLFECNTTIAIRAGKHSNNVGSSWNAGDVEPARKWGAHRR